MSFNVSGWDFGDSDLLLSPPSFLLSSPKSSVEHQTLLPPLDATATQTAHYHASHGSDGGGGAGAGAGARTHEQPPDQAQPPGELPLVDKSVIERFLPRGIELLEDIFLFAKGGAAPGRFVSGKPYKSALLTDKNRKLLDKLSGNKTKFPAALSTASHDRVKEVRTQLLVALQKLETSNARAEQVVGVKMVEVQGDKLLPPSNFVAEGTSYFLNALQVVDKLLALPVAGAAKTEKKAAATKSLTSGGTSGFTAREIRSALKSLTLPIPGPTVTVRSLSKSKSKSRRADPEEADEEGVHVNSGLDVRVQTVNALPADGVVNVSTGAGFAFPAELEDGVKKGPKGKKSASPKKEKEKKPHAGTEKVAKETNRVESTLVFTDTPAYWKARHVELMKSSTSPKASKLVLKDWLLAHFDDPHPSDEEKDMLAEITGLSRKQVANWFVNSRGRYWKPLASHLSTLVPDGGAADGGAAAAERKNTRQSSTAVVLKKAAPPPKKRKARREESSEEEEDEFEAEEEEKMEVDPPVLAKERARRPRKAVNYKETFQLPEDEDFSPTEDEATDEETDLEEDD